MKIVYIFKQYVWSVLFKNFMESSQSVRKAKSEISMGVFSLALSPDQQLAACQKVLSKVLDCRSFLSG